MLLISLWIIPTKFQRPVYSQCSQKWAVHVQSYHCLAIYICSLEDASATGCRVTVWSLALSSLTCASRSQPSWQRDHGNLPLPPLTHFLAPSSSMTRRIFVLAALFALSKTHNPTFSIMKPDKQGGQRLPHLCLPLLNAHRILHNARVIATKETVMCVVLCHTKTWSKMVYWLDRWLRSPIWLDRYHSMPLRTCNNTNLSVMHTMFSFICHWSVSCHKLRTTFQWWVITHKNSKSRKPGNIHWYSLVRCCKWL